MKNYGTINIKFIVVSLFFMGFLSARGTAQVPIELKCGKGYFADVLQYINPGYNWDSRLEYNPKVYGKMFDGSMTWFELSYRMKTGYSVALKFGNGATSQYYNDMLGMYWEEKYSYVYNHYGLIFSKNFQFGKHAVSPGFGISYVDIFESYVDYNVKFSEDDDSHVGEDGIYYSFPQVKNARFKELGVELNLDYTYSLTQQFNLGLRLSGNIPFGIGLETIMVSPFVSIRLD